MHDILEIYGDALIGLFGVTTGLLILVTIITKYKEVIDMILNRIFL